MTQATTQAMIIVSKSALAAAIIAVMAVSAHAQQGTSRQIQVLPAPGQQAQLQQPQAVDAPAEAQAAPQVDAPAPDAAPAPALEVAPKAEPRVAPAPGPKFVEPRFIEKPARKTSAYAGYSGGQSYGHRAPNCH